jgi:hypothetical protein
MSTREPVLRRDRSQQVFLFMALLATALALGGAMAHLLELPNKIGLPQDQYFVVQQIYRGWAQLAYLLAVQFLAMVALAVRTRRQKQVFWPVLIAILGLLAAQAVFWIWTFPANRATENWTVAVTGWEALRRQWEYSHAVGAICQAVSMVALIVAALRQARPP